MGVAVQKRIRESKGLDQLVVQGMNWKWNDGEGDAEEEYKANWKIRRFAGFPKGGSLADHVPTPGKPNDL